MNQPISSRDPGQELLNYNSAASAANAAEFRRCREMLAFNLRNPQWINITFRSEKQQNPAYKLKGSS